jgi:sodium/potassium-transporting ATPase subunit alpha
MIMFGLAFVQPLNIVFGTRDCIFMHFGIIAVPFGLFRLILDEIRKYLMRNLPPGDFGKPNYMIRTTLW